MKRTMMLMVAVACVGAVAMPAAAEDVEEQKVKKVKKVKAPKAAKVKGEKKPKPVLEEITISGFVSKEEKKGKGDKVSVKYVLTDGEGNKVSLPKPRKPKKKNDAVAAPAAINIADYLDSSVTVIGKGTKQEKKGKETLKLKEIISIEKLGGVADVEVFPEAS